MRIQLIAVGTRMPAWVRAGFMDYVARLPRTWGFQLVEISPYRQNKNGDREKVLREEGERMLDALPPTALGVALDSAGQLWDSAELASRIGGWSRDGRDVALLVGGAEGLAATVKARAELTWSLSKLTFPHALARVIVAEQLYRAWSILYHHPYHRA